MILSISVNPPLDVYLKGFFNKKQLNQTIKLCTQKIATNALHAGHDVTKLWNKSGTYLSN
jgi:hypothetical protein